MTYKGSYTLTEAAMIYKTSEIELKLILNAYQGDRQGLFDGENLTLEGLGYFSRDFP